MIYCTSIVAGILKKISGFKGRRKAANNGHSNQYKASWGWKFDRDKAQEKTIAVVLDLFIKQYTLSLSELRLSGNFSGGCLRLRIPFLLTPIRQQHQIFIV